MPLACPGSLFARKHSACFLFLLKNRERPCLSPKELPLTRAPQFAPRRATRAGRTFSSRTAALLGLGCRCGLALALEAEGPCRFHF